MKQNEKERKIKKSEKQKQLLNQYAFNGRTPVLNVTSNLNNYLII